MRRTLFLITLCLLGWGQPVYAQQEVDASKLLFWASGVPACEGEVASGVPSGGASCDFYLNTATGILYTKVGSTWRAVLYLSGTGTATRIPFYDSSGLLTDDSDLTFATDTLTVTSATVNSIASLGATTPLPYMTADLAVVRQRAKGATRYVGEWYLDPSGTLVWNAYDSTGSAYIPTIWRASLFTLQAPLTTTGTVTVGGDLLPDTSYTRSIGSLNAKWLSARIAELQVDTLVAREVVSDIGGRVLIASTTALTADVSVTDLTITVKYNAATTNDILRLEANGQVEFMKVLASPTGTSGAYIYSVQRDLDGTGINTWVEGDAVVNTGTTGDGLIDLYAELGILGTGTGPTIVGQVRTGTTYSDLAPRWAVGNLNGLYGYVVDTYGFAAGVPEGAWVKVDPTNGVRLGYNATTFGQISAAGAATFTAVTVQSAAAGARVSLDTTGLKGYDATPTLRFSVLTDGSGTLGTNGIAWTTAGVVTAAGWTFSAGKLTNVTGGNTVTLEPAGTYAMLAGPTGAPTFTLTPAGALTATNVSVTAGAATIDTNGITITPDTAAWSADHAYRFTASTGILGTSAIDTSGNRTLSVRAQWSGGGAKNATTEIVSTYGNLGTPDHQATMYAVATSSDSSVLFTADTVTLGGATTVLGGTLEATASIGTGTGGNYLCINTSTYEILRGNGSTCTASARRFKEDIRPVLRGLDTVRRIQAVSYTYKPEFHFGPGTKLGVIADDLASTVPEAVTYDAAGRVFGVDYEQLIPVLLRAIQDLDREVTSLKARQQ